MAQFLKVETTTAARAVTLIAIADILNIAEGAPGASNTVLTVSLKPTGGLTAAAYTVTVPNAADGVGVIAKAFTDAMVANPGGIVSTVVPPVSTAQAPLAQSGQQGKILITQQQVNGQFIDCTFATTP